jgi:hypothetical protein
MLNFALVQRRAGHLFDVSARNQATLTDIPAA